MSDYYKRVCNNLWAEGLCQIHIPTPNESDARVLKTIEDGTHALVKRIVVREAQLGQWVAELEAENERMKNLEDAVYAACFDHNSVDMSGKVHWARAVPVKSVLRQIFDAYGSEPLTPDGTVPGARAEEGTE